MEKYVLEALFIMGEPDKAFDRMHKRYAKMMAYADYTTLFEGWGIGAEGFGGGTINHAWSGGPLTMLSQKVCGIVPTSPGFRTFTIKPQLGKLNHASATVDTHYGNISVNLRREGKTISGEVTVPENTSCLIQSSNGNTITYTSGKHNIILHDF